MAEQIEDVEFSVESQEAFGQFGGYSNYRAIPNVIDGLKPGARRMLWAMREFKYTPDKPTTKAASAIGDIMKYHPHGDCISGDTKVLLLDGTARTMKELTEAGNEEWVISVTESGELLPSMAHSFRVGQHASVIYHVTLADKTVVKATANHPFLTRDGEWIKAEDLQPNTILYSGWSNDQERATVSTALNGDTYLQEFAARYINGDRPDGHVVHHMDENPSNNKPTNLEYLTRAEHANHHGDFHLGLENGRAAMFEDGGKFREATRSKNSALMTAVNSVQGVRKAIQVRELLIAEELELTEDNYSANRKRVYNAPKSGTLLEREHIKTWADFATLTADVNTEDAIGHTVELKTSNDVPRDFHTDKLVAGRNAKSAAQVVTYALKTYGKLTEESYEASRQNLILDTGLGHKKIHGRNYPKFSLYGSVQAIEEAVTGRYVNWVESVTIESLDESVPMYDFTVDGHENMFVISGDSHGGSSLVCVHNSGIYTTMTGQAHVPSEGLPVKKLVPLIYGQGSWGDLDNGAAAARYTECRLNVEAMALMGISTKLGTNEVDENGVDMVPNYSGRLMEPEILPALWPSFIVNGVEGIGTGTATQSASHNMREVLNLAIKMVDANPRWDTIISTLLGPDMPCEADIFDSDNQNSNIRTYMETGSGSFVMRARYTVEEYSMGGRKKGNQIIVTGFPFKVSPVQVAEGVGKLIANEDLPPNIVCADLSNADGLKLMIDIEDNDLDETIQRLFWFGGKTHLQESFAVFSRAVVNGRVRNIGTIEALKIWVDHRRAVVRRRSKFRLEKAEARIEIVLGLLKAIPIAKELVDLIRASADRQDAVDNIQAMKHPLLKAPFTENQAQAIMDMTMTQLTRLSGDRYEKERQSLQEMIDECNDLLHNAASLDARLKLEMRQVRDTYGTERRCNLRYGEDYRIERPERPAVERIPVNGYLVRTGNNWLRWATRSNVNQIVGTGHVVEMSKITDLNMLECVSSWGYHYRMQMENLPEKMTNAEALFGLDPGEKVVLARSAAVLGDVVVDIVMVTEQGLIKRVSENVFLAHKPGKYAGLVNLDRENTGDSVKFAYFLPPNLDIGIATSAGRFLRMSEDQIMAKGKAAKGIPAVRLDDDETIVWSGPVHEDDKVVYWTESENVGWFKVSDVDYKSRNTKGQSITRTKQKIAGLVVDDGDTLAWFNGSEDAPTTLELTGQTSNSTLSDRQLNKVASGIIASNSIWMTEAETE